MNRPADAIRSLERSLQLEPNEPKAWMNAGAAFMDLQHFEEADRCFTRAVQIDPQLCLAWEGKGYALELHLNNSMGH